MKCLNTILIVTMALALSSCAQFDKFKTGNKSAKVNLFDPKETSGPTTGHSYYNSSVGTTSTSKTTTKSVEKNTVTTKPVSTRGASSKATTTKKKTSTATSTKKVL